jgi:hypothetical protein
VSALELPTAGVKCIIRFHGNTFVQKGSTMGA